jgi:hypothetical protein
VTDQTAPDTAPLPAADHAGPRHARPVRRRTESPLVEIAALMVVTVPVGLWAGWVAGDDHRGDGAPPAVAAPPARGLPEPAPPGHTPGFGAPQMYVAPAAARSHHTGAGRRVRLTQPRPSGNVPAASPTPPLLPTLTGTPAQDLLRLPGAGQLTLEALPPIVEHAS